MRLLKLIRASALGLLVGLTPVAASAEARGPGESVRVTASAAGARLHIHIPGVRDRVLWSKDQIDAVALADVDNDGDLDLLAATRRHGLQVWRNTACGFELASASRMGPRRTDRRPGLRAAVVERDAVQLGDEHRDSADIPTDVVVGDGPTLSAQPCVEREPLSPAEHPSYAGRAPPALC